MKEQRHLLFSLLIIAGGILLFYALHLRGREVAINFLAQQLTSDSSQESLVLTADERASQAAASTSVIQIGTEDVPLYSEPSTESLIQTTVTRGEFVTYLEEQAGWYHVLVNDTYEGYIPSVSGSLITISEPSKPSSLAETVVVLDPGHGGEDAGAVNNEEDTYEKNITLATARVIKQTLEAAGCTVILTRTSDTTESLAEICAVSMANEADFFFSLHYDSTEEPNEASGTTTYYYYEKYAPLAETINDALFALPLENRGVTSGNFQVLRQNTRPALLLELGYMNNDTDFAVFSTKAYQQKVADALLAGLTEYLSMD